MPAAGMALLVCKPDIEITSNPDWKETIPAPSARIQTIAAARKTPFVDILSAGCIDSFFHSYKHPAEWF